MIFSPLDHYDRQEYHRLTKGMEVEFLSLPKSFMHHCEQIIFGNEYKELSYFCFHLYADTFYREYYERLSQAMEYAYNEVNRTQFKNLANNLANLLIFLREPKARVNDAEYKADNLKYWRDMVIDDEFLQSKKDFRKYLNVNPLVWLILFLFRWHQ